MQKNGFGVEIRHGEDLKPLAAEDAKWEKVIQATGYAQNP